MYLSKVEVFPLDDKILMFFWLSSIFRQMTMYLDQKLRLIKVLLLAKIKQKERTWR